MINVLMVDDDAGLSLLMMEFCAIHGIQVQTASDVRQAESALGDGSIDVVLLDIGLPGEDGLSFCRRLRVQRPALPIILVSGRSDDMDRILGLELGADDYVTKPFVSRELVARIRALHRRSTPVVTVSAPEEPPEVIRFGPFVMDIPRRELTRDETKVPLTNAEFDLLSVFARNPGRPLRRTEILEALSGGDERNISERGIDVTIVRLRKLLEDDPRVPNYIKTVWGVGYVFTP